MKLYERDYTVLSEEEEQYKRETSRTIPVLGMRTYDENEHCIYKKVFRHNEALFPNNYLDEAQLLHDEEMHRLNKEYQFVLDNPETTETNIKRMIMDTRAWHIPGSLFREYNFGHHKAYLFPEFALGTQYVVDYLLIGKASGGHCFVFVEFESPNGKITKKDGSLGESIRKGLKQVEDWKTFIEGSFATFADELRRYTNKNLTREFQKYDSTRFHYAVVAGKRRDFNEDTYRLARRSDNNHGILITHYDKLYDLSELLIGKKTY